MARTLIPSTLISLCISNSIQWHSIFTEAERGNPPQSDTIADTVADNIADIIADTVADTIADAFADGYVDNGVF